MDIQSMHAMERVLRSIRFDPSPGTPCRRRFAPTPKSLVLGLIAGLSLVAMLLAFWGSMLRLAGH